MKINTKEQIVEEFAKAWEDLNAETIISYLDDSFVYDSQWVFESLDCKRYIEYIRGKFKAIKESNSTPVVEIVPDNYCGGTMIRLKQGDNTPAFYRIEVKDGKVIKGDLCMF